MEIQEENPKEIDAAKTDLKTGGKPESFTEMVRACYGLPKQDIRTYSPLTLAYIGDSIYDLIIRTMLVERGNSQVNKLHHRASSYVKAAAQRELLNAIEPLLTEEEHGYYKRGRNAKSFTTAKNATIVEYRVATGFEALLGFLYLEGRMERIMELVKLGTDHLESMAGAGKPLPAERQKEKREGKEQDEI